MAETSRAFRGDIDFLVAAFSRLKTTYSFELPSAFAERVRYLTPDVTPFPGKFSFERFPYLVKPLDCLSPSDPTREVAIMKGNQLGFTTAVLENILLYNIMSSPKAQMFVTADAGLARTSVQIKIEKMIDGAGARELIFSQSKKKKGSRNSGDTSIAKEYAGGYLHIFGSKAPDRFRGMSYKFAMADEVDAFPDFIPKEGTVEQLVRNRIDAYVDSGEGKILWMSTPLLTQTSKIKKLYEAGTREKFFVPCKYCGEMQELVWHGRRDDGYTFGIVWENDERHKPLYETVAYRCRNSACGGLMKNYDKEALVPRGEWRPTAEAAMPLVKSFHITPLYNPPGMFSWENYVERWESCWDIEKNRLKDKEAYRVFRNTKQGLPFEDLATTISFERVRQFRRTGFVRGKIPNEIAERDSGSPVLILIASVDVQKTRLFVDVKGYSERGVTWTIDFFDIPGNTEQFNGPWDELDKYLGNTLFFDEGVKQYRIQLTLIDSGAYSQFVYLYAQRHSFGVYACKGRDWLEAGETYKEFAPSALQRIGLPTAFHINTGKLKDKISASIASAYWVSGQPQPDWYPNFPEDYRDDEFKMYEAETKMERRNAQTKQFIRTEWHLKYGAENHAFDTHVYNLAGLEIAAEAVCREQLGLAALDWGAFWEYARSGAFYTEGKNT